jgi:uncharacterized protein with ParB-like and HNH nuclease domain
MKSETIAVQQLFQDRRQYRVPFYQRAYVWNKEDQWERLWSDIQDKAEARLVDAKPVPHFLRDINIVSISLGEDDDAQVIFETLNGHGAELHATDLIRNFIFMRADREGAAQMTVRN